MDGGFPPELVRASGRANEGDMLFPEAFTRGKIAPRSPHGFKPAKMAAAHCAFGRRRVYCLGTHRLIRCTETNATRRERQP